MRCCKFRWTRRPWHITETRNHPLRKQTAKRNDANHRRVGRSTILFKSQRTIVWWKIRGQKFIDYPCVTLRFDCDGVSVFILKEIGSRDSSGPNSATYGNFWVISGALIKYVRICSWPVSKVLLINCAMRMKMCLITHQKFVRQVWIFSQYSHKLMTKLQGHLSVPITLKHALLAICMGEHSGHYAECAVHCYQTCVRFERANVQIPSDCGWRTPALGQCCQVCELRTADQVAFYTWQSLLHATALPIGGLHLEMGLPVDSVHGEIRAESL